MTVLDLTKHTLNEGCQSRMSTQVLSEGCSCRARHLFMCIDVVSTCSEGSVPNSMVRWWPITSDRGVRQHTPIGLACKQVIATSNERNRVDAHL